MNKELPDSVREAEEQYKKEGWNLFKTTMTILGIILLAIIAIIYLKQWGVI